MHRADFLRGGLASAILGRLTELDRPMPDPATSAPAATRIDVREFGAAGDGTQDDTRAIQQALALAGSSAGRIVFPRGKYRVTDTLTIGSSATIEGDSRGTSTIRYDGPGHVPVFSGPVNGTRVTHVGWEALSVESSAPAVTAFDFSRVSYSWVRDCAATLRGADSRGIEVRDAADGTGPYYCIVDNFYFSGGGQRSSTGIRFGRRADSSRTANAWLITGSRIAACGIGLDLQGENHTVVGVRLEAISTTGVRLGDPAVTNSALGCLLLGVGFEGGGGNYVSAAETSSGNIVIPGYVTGAGAVPVHDAGHGNTMLGGWAGAGMVLKSPNGTRFGVTVTDTGELSVVRQ